jgi:hypothetical protein
MAGWAARDTQTKERRNREWVMRLLLGLPLHDVDEALTVTVVPQPLDGVALPNAVATHYTAPAGAGKIVVIQRIRLSNKSGASRQVTVHIVPAAGAAGVATTIFPTVTLLAGESYTISGPFLMAPGDLLRAYADSAAAVAMRAEIMEMDAQPAGLTLKVVNGAALTNALLGSPGYYRVPTVGVTSALLLPIRLANTDSSSRTPEVHVVPTGGAGALANNIWADAMSANESVATGGGIILQPGDFLDAKASTGGVVGMRAAVLEAA